MTLSNGDSLIPKNQPCPMGPEKGLTSSVLPSPILPSSDACLESPHWSGSVSALLIPIGPFLQISPPASLHIYIYGPSESWLITSAQKMEIACFSEVLSYTNQSTWCLSPEEQHQKCQHHENLKSHVIDC
jgi:hypothetical protein